MLIKLKIWKEILTKFEELFFIKEGVNEANKKNGLFGWNQLDLGLKELIQNK